MSQSSSPDTLALLEVRKHFMLQGRRIDVLDNISFELTPGEAIVITGPSGSGKSTLLHLIGALDRPSSGHIHIGDTDPAGFSEPQLARFRNRHVGFVFQDSHLLPQYSVLENVLLPTLAFPGQSSGGSPDDARELLDRVGLGHRLGHRPAELSGGERQRAAVARALINRPPLLLCDEPTGSLDAANAREVGALLLEIHREQGLQLIVVTHSLELADRFERRLELREGQCFEA